MARKPTIERRKKPKKKPLAKPAKRKVAKPLLGMDRPKRKGFKASRTVVGDRSPQGRIKFQEAGPLTRGEARSLDAFKRSEKMDRIRNKAAVKRRKGRSR